MIWVMKCLVWALYIFPIQSTAHLESSFGQNRVASLPAVFTMNDHQKQAQKHVKSQKVKKR